MKLIKTITLTFLAFGTSIFIGGCVAFSPVKSGPTHTPPNSFDLAIPVALRTSESVPSMTPVVEDTSDANALKPLSCNRIEHQIAYKSNVNSSDQQIPRQYEVLKTEFLNETDFHTIGWASTEQGRRLTDVVFNLDTASFKVSIRPSLTPFPSLCIECNPYVFAQSADGVYQLAYYESPAGVWIASKSAASEVVMRSPWLIDWQWANDNSWVWLAWTAPEFGLDSAFISLQGEVIAQTLEFSSPLHATGHHLAFDTIANHLLSASSFGNYKANGRLNLYDMSFFPPKLIMSKTVSDTLGTMIWSQSDQEFLLEFVEPNIVRITTLNGEVVASVPLNIGDSKFQELHRSNLMYEGGDLTFVFSPSKKRLVLVEWSTIYVISCQ